MTKTQELITEQFAHLHPVLDKALAPLTYFKVGGPAEVFLELSQRNDIIAVIQFCLQNQLKFTVLGGASNVIIRDQGITGLVILLTYDEYAMTETAVRIGAGARTSLFVRKTVDDGLTGLEEFLGVPGRVGGAIFNNAHYLTSLIGEKCTQVEVIQTDGKVVWIPKAACDFSYDHSRFQTSGEVILRVDFQLKRGDAARSLEKITAATQYRAQTQPLGVPSSGCYFKNTPNTDKLRHLFPQFAARAEFPTAFLIDQAGFKGKRVGDIEVSQKHAAFLINTGHGTSAQTEILAKQIKAEIQQKYGVELDEEVFWI